MKRETIFSEDRSHRFTLWRDWSKDSVLFPDVRPDFCPGTIDSYIQFIGLNPSTADEKQDDPTIRKCIGFAKRWGFGAFCMTNLFGFRATDPEVMKIHPEPIGADNDRWILEIARGAGMTVCAWGNHGEHLDRAKAVRGMLAESGIKLHRLRMTRIGHPEHPLYIPYVLKPMEYPNERST